MEDKILEYLEAFEQAAQSLGPQAMDLALQVTYWDSVGGLSVGLFSLIASVALIWLIVHFAKTLEYEYMPTLMLPIVALAMAISGVIGHFFNIWNWVGVFAPHIRLARDIMERL